MHSRALRRPRALRAPVCATLMGCAGVGRPLGDPTTGPALHGADGPAGVMHRAICPNHPG